MDRTTATAIVYTGPTEETISKDKTILYLSWPEYLADVYKLSASVRFERYKQIVGISRGGLIPATMLSHLSGLPLVCEKSRPDFASYGEETLVVDDLLDTGKTLQGCTSDIAVVYRKNECPIQATYSVETMPQKWWIQFPYETFNG